MWFCVCVSVSAPAPRPADETTPFSASVNSEGCVCFRIAGGDSVEPAFLHSVCLKWAAATGMQDGLVFASLTRPDFESLSWTDGFTEQHFKAFIARQVGVLLCVCLRVSVCVCVQYLLVCVSLCACVTVSVIMRPCLCVCVCVSCSAFLPMILSPCSASSGHEQGQGCLWRGHPWRHCHGRRRRVIGGCDGVGA